MTLGLCSVKEGKRLMDERERLEYELLLLENDRETIEGRLDELEESDDEAG